VINVGLDIILNKIKQYDKIIIHGHIRPDGDCYGAQFGLKDLILSSFPKKKVYVVGETSEYVSFVGQVDQIPDSEYNGALSIVVDTATKDRISDQRYLLGKEVIKIDHHIPIINMVISFGLIPIFLVVRK
jgi:phosphoesterase RecJ-like protein